MNFHKPLLPSQDRYERKQVPTFRDQGFEYPRWEKLPTEIYDLSNPPPSFAHIFIWVCVLTGFALIGAAFAFYS